MKILNMLTSGETGGIESLCRDIGKNSNVENGFCFLSGAGTVYHQMKELGLTVYDLSKIGGKISFGKYSALKKIAKRYDVIVVHHGDPILKSYFILLAIFLNKKMVSMIHSCYDEIHYARYGRIKRILCDHILKKSMKISDKIIYVSEAGKKSYCKQFRTGEDKSIVVYNGISEEIIQNGGNNNPKKNSPYYITYIGRLSPVKGIKFLVKAVASIHQTWPVRLSIVGDGEERENLETLCKQYGIFKITSFYGQQIEIDNYLQNTAIFVYPSICQEVFGISLVEAMAYGIPCIASEVGGIPEIIHDGINGFLVQPSDDKKIAEKIIYIVENLDNVRIDEIRDNAKKTAQRFNITRTINQLETIFNEIVNN